MIVPGTASQALGATLAAETGADDGGLDGDGRPLAGVQPRDRRLGTCDGDPEELSGYSRLSDDARVTDWILTADGVREVERLDARFRAELDELAGRYGRPPGETTTRIDA